MEKLAFADVKDILVGCTIMSTGGGGDLEKGLKLVKEDFENGLEYKLLSPQEIGDNDLFTSPYFCGSIGPEDKGAYDRYPKIKELETVAAVRALERFFGEEIKGVVSVEYGGMNTAVAMSTGARLGKYIVDVDAAGRAVPDLQFSTYYVNEKPIYPLAVANDIGDVAIFEKVVDDFRAEDLVRALAVISGDMIGMSDHPVRGHELRESTILNALSYARKVGKAQRMAVEKGQDPITAIIECSGGYELFTGEIARDTEWNNKSGFTTGTIYIDGVKDYRDQNYRIWFKNENVISWLNGEPDVMVPDLICVVETDTGYPITNPFCKKGMQVTVLGFKAPEVWRSERGFSILNPEFFGFDVEYTPIEKRDNND